MMQTTQKAHSTTRLNRSPGALRAQAAGRSAAGFVLAAQMQGVRRYEQQVWPLATDLIGPIGLIATKRVALVLTLVLTLNLALR